MRRLRRAEIAQLYLVGFALVFLVTVTGVGQATQSQDSINATLFERLNTVMWRLERLENYTTAAILALVANFVAHLVQIRTQRHAEKPK